MPTKFVRSQAWFLYLNEDQKTLVDLAEKLWHRERMLKSEFKDYSFLVFPMAKAYEGFLKKFFYDMGLIEKHDFESKHFRIGRALNPNLRDYYQDEKWIYDDVERTCGPNVARKLWDAWTDCRNHLFHFYPMSKQTISLTEAGKRIDQLALAMQEAVNCKLEIKN